MKFRTDFAHEGSGNIPKRPFTIALQLRLRRDVEAEEVESLEDHRVASSRHGTIINLQGDTDCAIIGELQSIGQCRRERRSHGHGIKAFRPLLGDQTTAKRFDERRGHAPRAGDEVRKRSHRLNHVAGALDISVEGTSARAFAGGHQTGVRVRRAMQR